MDETTITDLTPDGSVPPPSTPTPIVSPTSLSPSDEKPKTPISTRVADFPPPPKVAQEMSVAAYDDFEDEQFEGAFDKSHFSLLFDSQPLCVMSQKNGILRIQRTSDMTVFADCSLSVDKPISVRADRLENMYASFLHKSDHQGGLANSTLTYEARFDDIHAAWAVQCGLFSFGDGPPDAMFAVFHMPPEQGSTIVYAEQQLLAYDRWYRFGLEVDHADFSLHCLIDGEEVGSYSVMTDKYADRLTNIRFLRWLGYGFDKGAEATMLLDDFYLVPPP